MNLVNYFIEDHDILHTQTWQKWLCFEFEPKEITDHYTMSPYSGGLGKFYICDK